MDKAFEISDIKTKPINITLTASTRQTIPKTRVGTALTPVAFLFFINLEIAIGPKIMGRIAKTTPTQQVVTLVCNKDLYSLKL